MNKASQFKEGAIFALSSTRLLWKHKILLLYGVIPSAMIVLTQIISALLQKNTFYFFLQFLYAWLHPLSTIDLNEYYVFINRALIPPFDLLDLLRLFIVIVTFFVNAALIAHVITILKNKKYSSYNMLSILKNISFYSWIVVCIVVSLIAHKIILWKAHIPFPLQIELLWRLLWISLTLFALPIIIVEQKNVLEAIKKSFTLFKKNFIAILSGCFLMGLIILGIFFSLMLFSYLMDVTFSLFTSHIKLLIKLSFVRFIIIGFIENVVVFTLSTIFVTIMYYVYTRETSK